MVFFGKTTLFHVGDQFLNLVKNKKKKKKLHAPVKSLYYVFILILALVLRFLFLYSSADTSFYFMLMYGCDGNPVVYPSFRDSARLRQSFVNR